MMKKLVTGILVIICLLGCLLGLTACGEEAVEEDNVVIARSALDSDEMIQELLDRSGALIGESNIIKELLGDILPGHISLISYDITLNRLTIEYGPTIEEGETPPADETEEHLNPEEFKAYWTLQTTEDIIFYNSSALFALIPNLESVQYLVEGYGLPTFTISRENMENFYGYALSDIDSVSLWKTKITDVFLDDLKIEAFFKEYPLKEQSGSSESEDPTTDDQNMEEDVSVNDETEDIEQPEVVVPEEVQ